MSTANGDAVFGPRSLRNMFDLEGFGFFNVLVLDVIGYALLLARNPEGISGVILSCMLIPATASLAAFWLPRAQLYWYNVFRIFESIQYLAATIALALSALDGTVRLLLSCMYVPRGIACLINVPLPQTQFFEMHIIAISFASFYLYRV